MPKKLTVIQMQKKIKANSIIDPYTNCWNWNKGKFRSGYGSVFDGIKSIAAHKASFEAFYGSISSAAKNTLVLHKCNNPGCVNPEHLYLGTKSFNMYDALTAKVFVNRCILSKEDRINIKQLYKAGKSMRSIAKIYKTNHPQISRVIKENTYAFC